MGSKSSSSHSSVDTSACERNEADGCEQVITLMDAGVAQATQPVVVPGVFSADDIESVKSLGYQMRRCTEKGCSHSWVTRYLHTNGTFKQKFPGLLSKLKDAAIIADSSPSGWGLLKEVDGANRLRPRVIEHHVVQPGGSLRDPFHFDEGSVFTVDVMLADPGVDFEGGAFSTLEGPSEYKTHSWSKGDALVFVSHKYHNVRPVTKGLREVLIVEFWEGRECFCPHRCFSRWDDCPLESAGEHSEVCIS